jgi:glycosyltransferase involved in cell wall biosynthesis
VPGTDDSRRLRVKILTQHYVPEITAARFRLEAFARGLARKGHEVEVICAVPNHPEGVVRDGYRRRFMIKREVDGVPVRYVWMYASPKRTLTPRLGRYLSFAATSTLAGVVASRPDVVLASSPPTFVGAAGAAVAARHRVPWVFDVRDLWPQAAVAAGELSQGRMLQMAEWLERRLYRSAAGIVIASAGFEGHVSRWADPAKITVVPNGTSQQALDAGAVNVTREEVALPKDGFVWLYAGNLGLLHGLEAVVDAAGELGPDYHLEMVGRGPMQQELEERSASGSGGISFRGLVEPTEAARLMRAADALIVSLDPHPDLADKVVPMKLFDSAASGRPIVLSAGEGEARRLAEVSGAALCVDAGDPSAIAGAIRRLREDPELRRKLGGAGREFAVANAREGGIDALEAALISAARRHPGDAGPA